MSFLIFSIGGGVGIPYKTKFVGRITSYSKLIRKRLIMRRLRFGLTGLPQAVALSMLIEVDAMNKKTYLKKPYLILAGAIICATGINSQAATPTLFEYGFKMDTFFWDSLTTPSDPLVPAISLSGPAFNFGAGLGSITFTVSGGGSHTVQSFLDFEIDENINTWWNEIGSTSLDLPTPRGPSPGQGWEIDNPFPPAGDIWDPYSSNPTGLDGTVGYPGIPEDVSVAMGWNFSLKSWQTATIVLNITEDAPDGFYLKQTDPGSQYSLYFSGDIDITGTPPPGGGGTGVPDGGSTLVMLTSALAAMGAWRSRRK
jgi:hypothetical protein